MYNNIDEQLGTVSDFELGANESAIRFIEQEARDSLPEQHSGGTTMPNKVSESKYFDHESDKDNAVPTHCSMSTAPVGTKPKKGLSAADDPRWTEVPFGSDEYNAGIAAMKNGEFTILEE